MTSRSWHGTKKCAISGAKIPRGQQMMGAKCPWCGNTQGAEIGSRKAAPSLEDQLAKLVQLHTGGVITDDELAERRAAAIDKSVAKPSQPRPPAKPVYRNTKPPSLVESWKKNPRVAVAVAGGLVVVLLLAWLASLDDGSASAPRTSASSAPPVQTSSAVSEVQNTLLGDAYIGSGSYTVHQAAKAYNSEEDFTAYSARVSVPGVDDLCLYWYSGGRTFGDGLTLGDTLTRQFSDWGAAASADSPAADLVRASARTDEGRAVVAKVGC